MRDAEYEIRWLQKFLARIDWSGGPDACWPWLGSTDPEGYGVVYHRRRDNNERAHRMAFEIANGSLDADILVLHSCDNPPCCNDAHLFIGTVNDNVQDKMAKGRHRTAPKTRVTKQCLRCGAEYEVGFTRRDTAKFCSVSCWRNK